MANRRMFSLDIIDSDAFLDMPNESQNLYFHLAMRADDDGFVNNPKKIQKVIGASDDAVKVLLAKRFILAFDSGVIVIKHWRMHNYIQNDRYKETNYKDEKAQLIVDENKAYSQCIQDVSKTETQVRLELGKSKDSLEIEIGKDKDILSATPLEASIIREIIDYLNSKAGTNYKTTTPKTRTLIKARLKEGFTLDDFYTVIDKKVLLWGKDIKMQAYLRPETLFGTKFESYLNEVVSQGKILQAQGVVSEAGAKGVDLMQEWLNERQ